MHYVHVLPPQGHCVLVEYGTRLTEHVCICAPHLIRDAFLPLVFTGVRINDLVP